MKHWLILAVVMAALFLITFAVRELADGAGWLK